MKKFLSIFTAAVMLTGCMSPGMCVYAADEQSGLDDSHIVIVHTNDAHCSIDRVENDDLTKAYIGYECVAGVYNEKKTEYANVSLADAGDHIQGAVAGSIDRGESIIQLMNQCNYTVSTLGNHEFDYGVDRLFELTEEADYPYVSCNFKETATDESVYDPYDMETYETGEGTVKVAYVGVTTPETLAKTASSTFKDDDGNYIYSFCQDEDGSLLYETIQKNVDEARANGADYVIIVGHLGQNGVNEIWRSDTIVENTTGIDAVIDGHSHESYIQTVKNKDGEDVLIAQTGSKLNAVGIMNIDVKTGEITDEVVQADLPSDAATAEMVSKIDAQIDTELGNVIATSEVDLYSLDLTSTTDTRLSRYSESNMGDMVADAFRLEFGADIGMFGGGSIRENISKGDITLKQMISVVPFGNDTCMIRATGQQILDALEWGARDYPEASGSFMQVSGMTYNLDPAVEATSYYDENGNFGGLTGQYRVTDVKVAGEALDLDKYYTVAGFNYYLTDDGGGMVMFDGDEVLATGSKDYELVCNYVQDDLNGVVGTEYENMTGQGRITFNEGVVTYSSAKDTADDEADMPADVKEGAYYYDAVKWALSEGVTSGTDDTHFSPDADTTRGQLVTFLWRAAGSPEPTLRNIPFGDLKAGSYYEKAVMWAAENGYVNGIDEDHFAPDQTVTRAQTVSILYRYAGIDTLEIKDDPFTDLKEGAYYYDAALWAVKNGVTEGTTETTFSPDADCSRGQTVTFLYRYCSI